MDEQDGCGKKLASGGVDAPSEDEITAIYRFCKEFSYTPQQVRDLDATDYFLLIEGMKLEADAMEDAKGGKKPKTKHSKGGSSIDGQRITSVADLVKSANGK